MRRDLVNCLRNCFLGQSPRIRILISSGLIAIAHLGFTQQTAAAPENFNPELESTLETKPHNSNHGDRPSGNNKPPSKLPNSNQNNPNRTVPESPQSAPNHLNLPTPGINNESSIESGTVDIELKAKSPAASGESALQLNNLTVDFQVDFDNFNQTNLLIKQKLDFNLYDLDFALDTGVNIFKQDQIPTISNIPLDLSWKTTFTKTDLTLSGGVDFFDRLAAVPRFGFKSDTPLSASTTPDGKLKSLLVLGTQVQHQAYKFNAETLENEITFWRFTPSIYWQIRPGLSFFGLGQYGRFSDDNQEFQSFSRLEKQLGAFFLAANLFTWAFETDVSNTSGYFSPPDFLVYNGEFGWQGSMFDETFNCKLSLALGKQSVDGTRDNAATYKALCDAQLLPNLELDLGYTYSNVRDRTTGNASFGNQSITGNLNLDL